MPPSLPVNWLPHVEQASGPRLAEGTAEEDGSGESGQLGSSGVLVNTLFQGPLSDPHPHLSLLGQGPAGGEGAHTGPTCRSRTTDEREQPLCRQHTPANWGRPCLPTF